MGHAIQLSINLGFELRRRLRIQTTLDRNAKGHILAIFDYLHENLTIDIALLRTYACAAGPL